MNHPPGSSIRIAAAACACLQLAGCVVLVPFVEPEQKSGVEARVDELAALSRRRGEYRTMRYPVKGLQDQKLQRLMLQMKSPVTLDRIYAAYDIGALGPKAAPAVPTLVQGLKDSTKFVRRASVKALAKIGPPACTALPDMKKSISDSDKFVGRSAENAVKKLEPSCRKAHKAA